MPTDLQRDLVIELRERIAQLERELERVTRERDEARREIRAAAGQAAAVGRTTSASTPVEPAAGLCAFCDGEGTYWVHDFEMKCRRCDGTGYAKPDTSQLPVSER